MDPASLDRAVAKDMRQAFRGPVVINGGFDHERGNEALTAGLADLVSFGKLFLANPDLPERFVERARLNTPDPNTFYGGDARGYIDYPTRHEAAALSS